MADLPTKLGSYYGSGRRVEVDGHALAASGRRVVVTVRIESLIQIRVEIPIEADELDGHPVDYIDDLAREVGEEWVRENAAYSWAVESVEP